MNDYNITQSNKNNKNPIQILNFSYYSEDCIGTGYFGSVYFGIERNKKTPVAIKIYKNKEKINISANREIDFMVKLKDEPYFPKIIDSIIFENKNFVLIESLLGPNLRVLLNFMGGSFNIQTVANIGIQLLERIEVLHKKGILHLDIKPANIVYGNLSSENNKDQGNILLIDYGLSKYFLDKKGKHVPQKKYQKFIGTLKYSSHNILNSLTPSRRDDLESFLYVLIYLYKGTLPWESLTSEPSCLTKYDKVFNMMIDIDNNELLCNIAPGMKMIYYSIINLKYDEEPPYNEYKILLENLARNEIKNSKSKYKFCWEDKMISIYEESKKSKNYSELNNIKTQLFDNYPIDIKKYIQSINPLNINDFKFINGINDIYRLINK